MNETPFYIAVAAGPISTLIVVLVGVLLSNSRISSVESNLGKRLDDMRDLLRAEIRVVDNKVDGRFNILDERTKIILGKIEEFDSRLTRMEGCR